MDLSYKEKSLIASLGVTLLVFGWYFHTIFSNLTLIENQKPNLNLLIYSVVLIVILKIIIHSFLTSRNSDVVQ
ncbi:MAG: hypothetical protein ACI9GW_003327 [Halieaceae bacterium]|jgi:hypothetical protein